MKTVSTVVLAFAIIVLAGVELATLFFIPEPAYPQPTEYPQHNVGQGGSALVIGPAGPPGPQGPQGIPGASGAGTPGVGVGLDITTFTGADPGVQANGAIASLASAGGNIYFKRATYNFATSIVMPRNVQFNCDTGTVLNYTGTGAAIVIADSLSTSGYFRGGLGNCTMTGPGSGTSAVGIFIGGDPGNQFSAPTQYGDFQNFFGGKIVGFGTGIKFGNNAWEDRFYGMTITGVGTGVSFPSGLTNAGENISFIGGAIQNSTTGIDCRNPNADFVFTNFSFDGIGTGSVVKSGDSGTTKSGCNVQLQNVHIEYFGNSAAAPVFSIWGTSPFTRVSMRDGVIQFDDNGSGFSIPAIADITGGLTNAGFEIEGTRISSNGALSFTNTCKQAGTSMCVSGDDAVVTALVKSYEYWKTAGQDLVGPNYQWGPIIVPSTTTNTDTYGDFVADVPVAFRRLSISYSAPGSPSCTGFPSFAITDVTKGVTSGSCAAVAGKASCLLPNGVQAMNINAGDTVTITTSVNASGCTASTNFYVTAEYRP